MHLHALLGFDLFGEPSKKNKKKTPSLFVDALCNVNINGVMLTQVGCGENGTYGAYWANKL